MKYLTMTGFTVRTASDRWTLGYEGENNSRTLQIKTTDDLTDFATVNLLIDTLDCGAMTVTTVSNYKVLSMVLTAGMLGEAGKKTCQLLMMDSEGTVIKKTNQFQMVVNTSNTVDGMAPDSPSVIIIPDYIEEKVSEYISDEFLEGKINDWLDDHPEATTTVQDGSITDAKLSSEVADKLLDDYYYPEITSWQERIYDTTCYFVKIPVRDSDGNIINPYLKYEANLTPLGHAIANHTTFTCNGTVACKQDGVLVRGHVMSRGRSVYNNTLTNVSDNFKYISINADRTISEFPVNGTTQSEMLAEGAYNVFCVYYKLINNSSIVDNSSTTNNEGNNVSTTKLPYSAIGVLSDNTLIFMAADGRTDIDAGLNSIQASEILLNKGCVNAWSMDGGGSVSYNIRGCKYNRNVDGNGTEDRLIHVTLNFKKESKSDSVTEAFGNIGNEKQNIIKQIIPYINDIYSKINAINSVSKYELSNERFVTIENGSDLNSIVDNGNYATSSSADAETLINCPTNKTFSMKIESITKSISDSVRFITIRDLNGDIFVRRNHIYSNANHYSVWKKLTDTE